MLDSVQYRLLKRICASEPTNLSGRAYEGVSKIRSLLGESVLREVTGKIVIDFGCGDGSEAIELAHCGASKVIGIDIRGSALLRARDRALRAGVGAVCDFCADTDQLGDLVISIDSFEHFSDPAGALKEMYRLLRPGGAVIISFGPTWYHPYGGHLFSVFPWAHLIFSESALIRWRSDIRKDGARRFSEVEGGLNQLTISRFEHLIQGSQFVVQQLEAVPIRRLRLIHNPVTREFTTSIVRCRLAKPVGQQPIAGRAQPG